LKHDRWKNVEGGFTPANNSSSESILILGNGRMGQRANFEEDYSGDSLLGNYIGGLYYRAKPKQDGRRTVILNIIPKY